MTGRPLRVLRPVRVLAIFGVRAADAAGMAGAGSLISSDPWLVPEDQRQARAASADPTPPALIAVSVR